MLNSLVDRVGMDPALVDDVFMVRLLAVFIIYIALHCIALHHLVVKTSSDLLLLLISRLQGCVSQAGEQASNVARNCVLASNLPESVPGTSLDRFNLHF